MSHIWWLCIFGVSLPALDGIFHCVFFFWGFPGLQLYELDGDPERKEFLDDLFVFMQKRGECAVYSVFQRDEYELSAYCVQVTVSHPPCGVPASYLAQENKRHFLPIRSGFSRVTGRQ